MPRLKRLKRELLLDDVLEDFMIFCTNNDLTIKTKKSYESSLKLFFKFLEEEFKIFNLDSVQEKHIREYISFTKERGKYSYVRDVEIQINNPIARGDFGKEVSITTINNYIRNIRVFFNWCFSNSLIKINPVVNIKTLKASRKPKIFMEDEEFRRLIKSLDLTTYSEYRDYVIIQLLMDTGMRITETLNLGNEHLLLDKRAIYIPAELAKGRRDRYVFFSPTMQTTLRKWVNYRDRYFDTDYLFVSNRNNVLHATNFEKNLKKYCIRAKLDRKITPHVFRNNFAKRCLMAGMDLVTLSKILGHSSVTVTEQAYLDLTVTDIRKNYSRFSPLENMRSR